jgi:hypothetical protein
MVNVAIYTLTFNIKLLRTFSALHGSCGSRFFRQFALVVVLDEVGVCMYLHTARHFLNIHTNTYVGLMDLRFMGG